MANVDDIFIRRLTKRLRDGEIYVSQIQLWDAETWHVIVNDTHTEDELRLEGLTAQDALPFVEALASYAHDVVSDGMA